LACKVTVLFQRPAFGSVRILIQWGRWAVLWPRTRGVCTMRWAEWIFVAATIGSVSLTNGVQAGCAGCKGSLAPWDAEACASPPGYAMTPGCGEMHRPCCDNAWAGYCDQRAKMEVFWSSVGVPKVWPAVRPGIRAAYPAGDVINLEPCPMPATQSVPTAAPANPIPAPPPAPTPPPAPKKGVRSAQAPLFQW
jgi:hypothetical protein